MVGAVGQDALAEIALQNLHSAADISRVARLPEPTGCASVFLDGQGRNMIAVASGANLSISSEAVDDGLLDRAGIVVMQMENDVAAVEALIRRVRRASRMSILNLAPAFPLREDVLSQVDLIVVNEDEAAALAGWLDCGPSARSLAERLGTGVLRTLGGDGAEANVSGENIRVAAMSITVKDTTAAGDCFVGVLASSLDQGLSLRPAMQRASLAAGLACSRAGSQGSIPFRQETDLAG